MYSSVNIQAVKGVVSYVDAKDIPGMNDWMMDKVPEPIFSTTRSEYAGQPVGVIVAETRELAIEAAKLVKITYANQGVVITDMEESMKNARQLSNDEQANNNCIMQNNMLC